MDLDQTLKSARNYVSVVSKALVSRVDPAHLSHTAKIPYKVLVVREALMYRAADLAEGACDAFEKDNLISAACTVRAFQETLAVLFYVNRKSKTAVEDKNVKRLDEDIMKILMGMKNNPNMRAPINILTMIDRVDREIPQFRAVYDNLSEHAHPNWAGTSGLFSKHDPENMWTDFGKNVRLRDSTRLQGVIMLNAGLQLLVQIYNEFADFLPTLIKICEEKLTTESST